MASKILSGCFRYDETHSTRSFETGLDLVPESMKPAELSYMTAPVVWFSTDVLAGAGLNVPRQELRSAPVVEGKEKVVLPFGKS